MNHVKILSFIAGLALTTFIVTLLSLFYVQSSVLAVHKTNTTLVIGEEVGFNLDRDALHFGTLRYQGSATRALTIPENNNYLIIKIEGNITPFIFLDQEITKNPGTITFRAINLEDIRGDFKGEITIYEVKKYSNVLESLLPGKRVKYKDYTPPPSVILNIER